ncbi:MAG: hypothetical protein EOM91_02360 [Sphingobacteriia bacterium]|nr:hypothetical protein [Sphingobacteriia bacterium]NCC39273.1 hypothetical protein [Gammaproteobacteria bacterium]
MPPRRCSRPPEIPELIDKFIAFMLLMRDGLDGGMAIREASLADTKSEPRTKRLRTTRLWRFQDQTPLWLFMPLRRFGDAPFDRTIRQWRQGMTPVATIMRPGSTRP